jgi:UDP-GlcNAc3NAcA epimerase
MKIITVIGARPQFIKAAAVSGALSNRVTGKSASVQEFIVHTGQHYDYNMSRVFFDELGIPEPHWHLEVSSASHGHMTAKILAGVENVLVQERPDWVLVYGDTNSTLAGALAAAKLNIPVAHIEAGLRSFNRRMPEEINRVLTDHVSQLLFVPTDAAVTNLAREGITGRVFKVGDVMLDAFLYYKEVAESRSRILDNLGLDFRGYYLATVHRQENTDNPHRLSGILDAMVAISNKGLPVLMPLHPRTRKCIEAYGIRLHLGSNVRLIEPIGYLDMIHLEANAALILTDSGGIQKEACFAGVPCVTLRDETEWVETVAAGINFLAGAQTDSILSAFQRARGADANFKMDLYGDGRAGEAIVEILQRQAQAEVSKPETIFTYSNHFDH